MARARIQVAAVHVDAVNVQLASPVQLSNDDEGGETTYAWTLIDKPEGSATVISNSAIENPTITPDLEGTYQLRLVVNLGSGTESIDTCSVAVLRLLDAQRIPAAAETIETGSARGWALATNRIHRDVLDDLASGGPVIAAVTSGGFSPGQIVNVSGCNAVGAGHDIPAISAATGSEAAASGQLGVLIDGVTPGDLGIGAIVLVRIFGIAPVAVAGSPAVGAPVFVSDAGLPSLTVGTYPRLIGRVASASGGSFRWFIDGRDALNAAHRRSTNPTEMTNAVLDWVQNGATGAGPLCQETSSAAASPLIIPLRVWPGEILDAVTFDVNQGSTTALCVATLSKGSASGNTSSNAIASPGTNGAFQWTPTFTGSLTLPASCAAGEKFWVTMGSSGAGGTTRRICGATARSRPAR